MIDILLIDETGEVIERFRGVSKEKQKQIAELLGTSREKKSESKKTVKFVPPTVDQVRAYCIERGNEIDPEKFVDHYKANGWKQNRGLPLVDWEAAVRTWEKTDKKNDFAGGCKKENTKSDMHSFTSEKLEEIANNRYKSIGKKGGEKNGG